MNDEKKRFSDFAETLHIISLQQKKMPRFGKKCGKNSTRKKIHLKEDLQHYSIADSKASTP